MDDAGAYTLRVSKPSSVKKQSQVGVALKISLYIFLSFIIYKLGGAGWLLFCFLLFPMFAWSVLGEPSQKN